MIKNDVGVKIEQEETDELLSAVSDLVKVVEKIDGIISNNKSDKTENDEKIFRFLEMELPLWLYRNAHIFIRTG